MKLTVTVADKKGIIQYSQEVDVDTLTPEDESPSIADCEAAVSELAAQMGGCF